MTDAKTTKAAKPTFFASPSQWREWLEGHHDNAGEELVGFYKRASGKPSITWPEAVDQALCYGWIDGVRKRIDAISYTIRFTPRKRASIWSGINIKRVGELSKLGLMSRAGLEAFRAREEKKSRIYSYEQLATATLAETEDHQFRADRKAWKFFASQAPWYRRAALWWVVSAKKEATRAKRLGILIEDSAQGLAIAPLRRRPE
jgi:uncharacterized protein YdeI (YjbR/CyaY-like superfamily)